MSEFIQGITLIVAYRAFTIACGLVIVYLGFVLFRLGVYEKAGELKAAWGTKNLTLKQAAPGTFFALFGAAIITATVWRGIDFESVRTQPVLQQGRNSAQGVPGAVPSPTPTTPESPKLPEAGQKSPVGWLDKLLPDEARIHYKAFRTPEESEKKWKWLNDPTKAQSG